MPHRSIGTRNGPQPPACMVVIRRSLGARADAGDGRRPGRCVGLRDRRHRAEAGRGPLGRRAEPRSLDLQHVQPDRADPARRREHRAEPGAAAGAGRGAGQLRPAAHPRRPRQYPVPHQQRHPARGPLGVRPGAEPAVGRQDRTDHRGRASAVRHHHSWHRQHHHQERHLHARRRSQPVRWQPWRVRAELRIRRLQRRHQLLRLGQLSA